MASEFDIVIVGAGAVGGSLAYALSQAGYSVALVEKTAVSARQQPAFDERHLGFSRGTAIALEGMGLWQGLSASAVPIERIHVSAKGHFGSVMMDARDEGLDALGYVLPAREIGRVLHQSISQQGNIRVIAPAQLLSASIEDGHARIELEHEGQPLVLHADLLIGADGAGSRVRELFSIQTTRWTYDQSAVIANMDVVGIDSSLAHERFMENGALALLPRSEQGYAIICSVIDEEADRIMAMDDDAFAGYIAQQMGGHIQQISTVGKRYRFPLELVRSREVVREHLALVGNAAHFIHPVAAQGFNLSMRDVSALVESLIRARNEGRSPGSLSVLRGYADWRKQDERLMVAFTDGLIRLFINPLLPVSILRQKGLLALRHIQPLRRFFTRSVTGRLGRQSNLMRGLGLQ
jgi:2-octaprenyl-6-methoxyphenol hydroxylase